MADLHDNIDRDIRIATRCAVVLETPSRKIVAESEDLSRRGVFVCTGQRVDVGTPVTAHIEIPLGPKVVIAARVAHGLTVSEAKALGRRAGLGLEFDSRDTAGRKELIAYLDCLIDETTPPPEELLHSARLLIAHPARPLVARLRNALEGAAGFVVTEAHTMDEVLLCCRGERPDVVLADAGFPPSGGADLFKRITALGGCGDLPVALLGNGHSNLDRLEAYRVGVQDFITTPFTDEEIAIRLKRLSMASESKRMGQGTATLRGALTEISLATLLSLFDFERKSGILLVLRDQETARVHLRDGRIVQIEGPTADESIVLRVQAVLSWSHGNFEFMSAEVTVDDALNMSSQMLLLEHARLSDEGGR